jgi:hypothetical protein
MSTTTWAKALRHTRLMALVEVIARRAYKGCLAQIGSGGLGVLNRALRKHGAVPRARARRNSDSTGGRGAGLRRPPLPVLSPGRPCRTATGNRVRRVGFFPPRGSALSTAAAAPDKALARRPEGLRGRRTAPPGPGRPAGRLGVRSCVSSDQVRQKRQRPRRRTSCRGHCLGRAVVTRLRRCRPRRAGRGGRRPPPPRPWPVPPVPAGSEGPWPSRA